jgi:hypothetical protein
MAALASPRAGCASRKKNLRGIGASAAQSKIGDQRSAVTMRRRSEINWNFSLQRPFTATLSRDAVLPHGDDSGWLTRQSKSNRSRGSDPCYQGKIQGIYRNNGSRVDFQAQLLIHFKALQANSLRF